VNDAAERRALWVLRLAGTAVLVLFLTSVAIAPRTPVRRNTPGFRDPVVGFEFASQPEHVFGIVGRPGSAERGMVAVRMRLVTWIDFVFLVAYPCIYVGIALLLATHGRAPRGIASMLIVLAAAMAIGDALENGELLRLMQEVDPSRMAPALVRLRIFTLVKWYAVYAASGLVAVYVGRETGWWRWSGIFFALAALLGLAAIIHLPAIEWSVAPLGVAWLMSYVRAFRR
jgi:hypothetical protein